MSKRHEDPILARIARLEAELAVRTKLYLIPAVPEEFRRGGGVRSAWASGYEIAWRGGTAGRGPYERQHLISAYLAGFETGAHDAESAILERLKLQL